MFGNSPFGSTFGKPAANTPSTSLFGSAAPSTGFGGFGQTTTQTTQPTGFGGFGGFGTAQPTAQTTTSPFGGGGAFGGAQPTAQTTTSPFGGGFGGATAQTTTSPFGGGAFGGATNTTTSPFGGGGGLFGQQPTTTTPSLLSTQTGASPFGGGAFGSNVAGTQLGGQNTAQTGASPFSLTGVSNTSSPFGGGAQGGFGGGVQGGFGGGARQGTTIPYQQTTLDGNQIFVAITAMPQYSDRSFEELRFEDITHRKDAVYKTGGVGATNTGTMFGAQPTTTNNSPFGQQTSTPSPFGQFGQPTPAQPTTSLFGQQPSTSTVGGGLFGQQPATSTVGGGLFGQATTQQTGSSLFGQQPTSAATGGGLFGQQPAQQQGSSLFGQQPTAATGGLFGNTTQGTSPFGQQPTQQQQGSSLFGQQPTAATGGLFGNPTQGSSLFGQQPAQQTSGGLFGATPTQPTTGGGLFGNTQSSTTGGGLFGNTQPSTSGGLFGNTTQTTQNNPSPFSLGGLGQTQQPQQQQQQQSLFGNTGTATNTGGLFGNTQTSTTNTGGGLFGNTTTQTPTPLFGNTGTTTNTGGGLFGNTQPSTTPTSLFGNTGATGTNGGLFGSTQPSTATSGGLFGNTQTSTGGGGLFGNTQPSTATTGGLFGNTQTSTGGGGLFGGLGTGQTTPSLSTTGGLFGNTTQSIAQQPTTSLFGNTATSGGLGLGLGLGLGQAQQTQQPFSLTQQSSLGQPTSSLFSTTQQQPLQQTQQQPQQQTLLQQPLQQSQQQPLQQTQQPTTIQLNNQINAPSPYFPIASPAPFATFVKDVTSTSKQVVSPPSYTQRSLSHHGYIPKSTTKLVPRRGGPNTDLGFSILPNPNGLFPIDKFIGKHSKSLNINTTNETEDSLRSSNTSFFNSNNNNNNNNNDNYYNALPSSSVYSNNNNNNNYNNNNNNNNQTSNSNTNNNLSSQFNSRNAGSSSSFENGNNNNGNNNNINNNNNNDKSSTITSPTTSTSSSQPNIKEKEKLTINPNAPKLTKEGYQCNPSIAELSKKSDKELKSIVNFSITKDGCGSIYYPGPTNLTGCDLDEIVEINPREVSVYKDENTKPEVGSYLNREAIVTLEDCWPKNKKGEYVKDNEGLVERYENALRKVAAKSDCDFISYNRLNGTWMFKVKHFSKYSAPDDFDEDEQATSTNTNNQQQQQTSKHISFQQPATIKSKPKFTANLDNFDSDLDSDSVDEEYDQDMTVPQKKTFTKTPFVKRVMVNRESGLFDTSTTNSLSTVVPISSENFEGVASKIARVSEPSQSASSLSHSVLKFSPPITNVTPQQQPKLFKPTSMFSSSIIQTPPAINNKKQLAIEEPMKNIQPTNQIKSINVLPQPTISNRNFFSKIRVDPTVYDRIVPKEESIIKELKRCNENNVDHTIRDTSLFMKRSFRVGWAPGGKFIVTSKGSIKTLLVKKLPTDTKEDKKDSIIQFLDGHLSHSSEVPPHLRSNGGWFSLAKINEQIQSQLSLTVPASQSLYYKRIWSLISNLWGNISTESGKYSGCNYSEDTIRKLNLNQWLKDIIAPLVREEQEQLKKKSNSNYLEQIFSFLTAKQISEASNLANENKDFRLATMISQIWSSNQTGKDLIMNQLKTYHSNGSDKFINEKRLEILQLVSGDINRVYKNINDWVRCFAISFWFKYSLESSIENSVESFERSFNSHMSVFPLPPYLAKSSSNNSTATNNQHFYDICFLLLKLFAVNNRNESSILFEKFENIFYPENIGQDLLDYHLSWNLYTVLKCIPLLNKQPDLSNQSNIHSSFASQLERLGLWKWSIYVLLHMPDKSNYIREEAVKSIIARAAPIITAEDKLFLTTKLFIPELWIDEAKAWYTCYDINTDVKDQIDSLFKSYQYSKIHEIVFSSIGPNYIIQKGYHSLKNLLVKLEPHSSFIQTWRYGGAIFLEFTEISIQYREIISHLSGDSSSSSFDNNNDGEDEIQRTKYYLTLKDVTSRIVTLLSDISKLIHSPDIKNTSASYKQSLSFMSEALLTQAILLKDLPENMVKLVSTNSLVATLNTLPLTQNYRSKNLESLTNQIQDTLLNSIYEQ